MRFVTLEDYSQYYRDTFRPDDEEDEDEPDEDYEDEMDDE